MLGMININLLPSEFKKVEKTPLSRFIVILVGVVLVVMAGGFWGYFNFVVLEEKKQEKVDTDAELVTVTQQHKHYKDLVELQKKYDDRATEIKNIRKERRNWTKTISDLYDLMNIEPFLNIVWISDLNVTNKGKAGVRPNAKKTAPGRAAIGELSMTVHTAGKELPKLSDFRDALVGKYTRDPAALEAGKGFHENMGDLNPPDWKLDTANDMEPSEYYTSPIKIPLLELSDPASAKKPGAPGTPPKPPGGSTPPPGGNTPPPGGSTPPPGGITPEREGGTPPGGK